ncbi:MAG: hypothetical protein KAG20_06405 [Cocleimonas sp.]|nr:hypothetical protein [Cocleimonas sp.]
MSINPDTIAKAEKELLQLEAHYKELAADAALTAASMAPPPLGTVADVVSIGKSLWTGDWGGALLDVVGLIPIVGDGIKGAAKGTKIANKMKAVADAISVAKTKLARQKNRLLKNKTPNQAIINKKANGASIKKCDQQRPIPKGGVTVEKRVKEGGSLPPHVKEKPEKYYYNTTSKRYVKRPAKKPNFSELADNKIPCFPKGTPVATPTGMIPIEHLTIGTSVFAFNEATQTNDQKKVTALLHNKTTHLIDIALENEILQATLSHRFWVENKHQWIAAQYLEPTMTLKTRSSDSKCIQKITINTVDEQKTYNLSIDDLHTYFIGHSEVLVHNADEVANGKIYIGRDPITKEVIYIGQTKQELDDRIAQHRNDARKHPEKYKFKKDMVVELAMDGLTDDQMDYQERRLYDAHGGHEDIKKNKIIKNKQLPMSNEKIALLEKKYCK